MLDSNALADLIAELVGEHVERSLAPLIAENVALTSANCSLSDRIAALEARTAGIEAASPSLSDEQTANIVGLAAARAAELVELPSAPSSVEIVQSDEFAALLERAASDAVAMLPPVAPIAPDMAAIRSIIEDEVSVIPPVEPLSPDMDAIEACIANKVKEAITAIPPVEPLAPDMPAIEHAIATLVDDRFRALPPPEKGADGVGVAGALIDRDGALVVTLSNGQPVNLGRVVGKDGEPGDHGIPFGPDDLDMTLLDDGRTLRMAFSKGDTEYAFQIGLPVPIYRGVWREGEAYAEGDMVTWAGSTWHCGAETTVTKPGDPAHEWVLAVKAGRPGRDKT